MLMDVSSSFHSAHTLRFRVQELGRVGYKDYRSCSKQTTLSGSAERYLMWSCNDVDHFLLRVACSVCKDVGIGAYYQCNLHEDIYCMEKFRD